ncbi:hypothetical protein GQ43DRAFT_493524, partial [Delitschia confertaspora ATCC 74209]
SLLSPFPSTLFHPQTQTLIFPFPLSPFPFPLSPFPFLIPYPPPSTLPLYYLTTPYLCQPLLTHLNLLPKPLPHLEIAISLFHQLITAGYFPLRPTSTKYSKGRTSYTQIRQYH